MAGSRTDERVTGERELAGDFTGFFREHYPRLCRGLYLLAGGAEEAEDLAQEAMSRVYERWARVGAMDSPSGYLWQTALNLNRKRARRSAVRRRRTVHSLAPAVDPSAIAATGVDVRAALAQLTVEHREALVLVDWLELDSPAAARVLGIEPASVRSRVHRARERMRGLLEGDP